MTGKRGVFCWVLVLLIAGSVSARGENGCDRSGYRAVNGISAEPGADGVTLTWPGEKGEELRARFTLRDGQPVVGELAARSVGGAWEVLGSDLAPEFQVTTGKRRISPQQVSNLKKLGIDSPEEEAKRKWNTFWDAPLVVPGHKGHTTDLPRHEEEIRRGTSTFAATKCKLASDGDRVSVTFDGLTLGIFAGDLRFTVYKGSNLLRQEAIAKTEEPSVAFIYKAGLKGFHIGDGTQLVWRDTARAWQSYAFGGEPNTNVVNLRVRNRLEILDAGKGSLGIFPPPHKFFFARENEVNLGYVYYRKDSGDSFSLGVMQPERGEGYVPWGVTDAEWKRRSGISEEQLENFALYNAPPGTEQHMAVYYYLSPRGDRSTQESVLAYTHGDVFKPVPGFKVLDRAFPSRPE